MSVKINHYAKLPYFFLPPPPLESVSSLMQRESLTGRHRQGNHGNEPGVVRCDSLSGIGVTVHQEGVDVCMVCVARLMV